MHYHEDSEDATLGTKISTEFGSLISEEKSKFESKNIGIY
jgi:hypothetical protein